jgi:hypothetical protein
MGEILQKWKWLVIGGGALVLFAYTADPIVGSTLLDKTAAGALGIGDKMLAQRNIKLGSNLGREIEVQKNGKHLLKARYYRVGHMLRQLTSLTPLTNQVSRNVAYFLDSFKLIAN